MANFEEKTLESKMIYKGKVIQLELEQVELPDGKQSTRELVRHPGAVAVIATTEEGKIILVEQYRKALEKSIVEIPAGKMEKGEDPKQTAWRELYEETGYQAGSLELLTSFYTSPGFADEIIYIYEASELKKGEQQLDDDEFVTNLELSFEECEQLVKEERIHDAKTAYALMYLKLKTV
ncbi:ADP-ribose pyrophosphatase [Alkalihalobacillus xiaoxiensis]|uniref:ADP-ribose pyrophosphatase n=1 Tax=Shouchella xiaoxiensis TaxID=766895 RepID=A0ABS2SRS7_9BACI|nr:NUDIX hydrolase [Shouchella xiaoxiensis]MBM7838206.1 ADP-ribose pyrophosphatase [Shouchella xiaoxiensis]